MPAAQFVRVCAVGALLAGCAPLGEARGPAPSGPLAAPFVADSTEIGTLTIVEEYGALVLDARMNAPWSIAGARVYAGPAGLPVDDGDAPAVERFPYAIDLPQPVTDYSLELPLSALGGACGESLTAAVRLSVVAETPEGQQSRTVWARLPDAGPALAYTPRCTPRPPMVADGEIFYEEISDELVDDGSQKESVAER